MKNNLCIIIELRSKKLKYCEQKGKKKVNYEYYKKTPRTKII